VYIGTAGGEFGIRGHLLALDASNGRELWRFYTIPDPNSGEPGANTWPKDNDSWKHGGAPIWTTPSVDPKLGLIYFSTGNASPDVNGEQRAGDNLFANSIVALNASTGKYVWHFQEVHHDIWDYDSPNPTILYDAVVKGKVVHGIAQAPKTGWLYMLDRKTGKPIFPINETPVTQSQSQRTAKTQPIPTVGEFAKHDLTDADFEKVKAAAETLGGKELAAALEKGKTFDPGVDHPVALLPGSSGGANWPASSYNQKLQMFYICSQNSPNGFMQSEWPGHKPGQFYIGSLLVSTGFHGQGNLTAIDAQTGEIAWQVTWADSCYSGSITTAGNLVFTGQNSGEFQAYDARNGSRLWSFQTGAGVNTTATTFTQDGKQYIALTPGGNSLVGSPRGTDVWLFALDGTIGPAKAPGTGAGAIAHAGEATAEKSDQTDENTVQPDPDTSADAATADVKGDATAGKQVFADNCSTCHGADGMGGNGGPDLSKAAGAGDLAATTKQITKGGGGMPAFQDQLNAQQIADVAAFVVETIHG
jgi:alcohol dehydrogenase (cytochrome c)